MYAPPPVPLGLLSMCALWGLCITADAIPGHLETLRNQLPRHEDAMANASPLTDFVDSLLLPPAQAVDLRSALERDPQVAAFLENRDAAAAAAGTGSAITPACTALKAALGAQRVDTEPLNQTNVDINWSETCWKAPACIVQPNSTQDVSVILKVIAAFQVKFAVRSGGHSPNPGWSSVDQPGVLIDLARLNHITVSSDRKTVKVGPGQRWGSVIETLDQYAVSVIGGRVPDVGVGGLILGGGYFHFSGEYGLAADNVKSFEVVLANGAVTRATATENSDLFWALKGGGPNFGIVTCFELYTIPVHEIWFQGFAFSNDNLPQVLNVFAAWQSSAAFDVKATVSFITTIAATVVAFVYSAPAAERPAAFAPFDSVVPLGTAIVPPTNGTVLSFMQISNAQSPQVAGRRHDYRAASSKVSAQLYKDVFDVWVQGATAANAKGVNQTFVIQHFPKSLVEQGIAKGGNPMGMPRESFQSWTTLVDWERPQDDAFARSTSINTAETWRQLSTQRGLGVDYLYMNDASRDQNPLASYGAANIAKLKAISAKYDPSQLFQKLQNDGFLLRKL